MGQNIEKQDLTQAQRCEEHALLFLPHQGNLISQSLRCMTLHIGHGDWKDNQSRI